MKFITLIKNELIKLWNLKSICIYSAILLLACILPAQVYRKAFQELDPQESNPTWRSDLEGEIQLYQKLLDGDLTEAQRASYTAIIEWDQLRLDEDIDDSDWRVTIIETLLNTDMTESERTEYERMVRENDWRAYCAGFDETYIQTMEEYASYTNQYKMAATEHFLIELRYQYEIPMQIGLLTSRNWQNRLLSEYSSNVSDILSSASNYGSASYTSSREIQRLEQRNLEILYRLEHNLPENLYVSTIGYMKTAVYLHLLIITFACIISIQCFGNEYSTGNIKQLLSYPFSRSKIFLAKLCSVMLSAFIAFALLYLVTLLTGAAAYGGGLRQEVVVINGSALCMNPFVYLAVVYLLHFIEALAYVLLAILLYFFIGNTGTAIGISVLIGLVGKYGTVFAADKLRLPLLRFVPFVWLDLTQYFGGTPYVDGITFLPTLAGCIVCLLLLLVTNLWIFSDAEC